MSLRIACIQTDVVFGDADANAELLVGRLASLADQGVQLAVFPEAYLTGYCTNSIEATRQIAVDLECHALRIIEEAVNRFGVGVVVGFAELLAGGVSNSAALFEPGRPRRIYRKVHLPFLGMDRFTTPGDRLDVFDTSWGRIGVLICYDLRVPEAARTLALKGAELIVLPTNWPDGAQVSATHVAPTRAAESWIFLAACNRVGVENGVTFIGRSGIYDPEGHALALGGPEADVIFADLDLAVAREKRRIVIPGEYETAIFDVRQPNLYEPICDPISDPRLNFQTAPETTGSIKE